MSPTQRADDLRAHQRTSLLRKGRRKGGSFYRPHEFNKDKIPELQKEQKRSAKQQQKKK